jgi:hypothetical protein
MLRLIAIILLLVTVSKAVGQDSSRNVSYHFGFTANYVGPKSPEFALPVGFGSTVTATLNKFQRFKPTIELNAVGFPEYVIHLTNNSTNEDSKYAYGVYTLLVGTKLKIHKAVKFSLTSGPAFNSREDAWRLSMEPSIELNTKRDKILIQLYYLNMFNSQIMNGYTGVAILFKFR